MARIAGVDIPREKRVEIALTYVYGVGLPTSQKIKRAELKATSGVSKIKLVAADTPNTRAGNASKYAGTN